ncbi:MAG: hypothetical protein KKB22_06690, partial [Candidatus Omnitrophica bacterium]|nr:hypothetical protein [Candidatus Omnitrophota bacterium]
MTACGIDIGSLIPAAINSFIIESGVYRGPPAYDLRTKQLLQLYQASHVSSPLKEKDTCPIETGELFDYISILAGGRCPTNCSFCVGQYIRDTSAPHFAPKEDVLKFIRTYSQYSKLFSISGSTSDPMYTDLGLFELYIREGKKAGMRLSLHTHSNTTPLIFNNLSIVSLCDKIVLSAHDLKNIELIKELVKEFGREKIRISSVCHGANKTLLETKEFYESFSLTQFTIRLNIYEPGIQVNLPYPKLEKRIFNQPCFGDENITIAVWDFKAANEVINAMYLWPDGTVNPQCYWKKFHPISEEEKNRIPGDGSNSSEHSRSSSPVSDYFYSKSLKLHVAREPLKVDARVIQAADKLNVKITWDDEGNVVHISRNDGSMLLKELGATMLTPAELWIVYKDAQDAKDEQILKSLTSLDFAEWFDVHFMEENGKCYMIEHPKIEKNEDGTFVYKGDRTEVNITKGRAGWFNPQDNTDTIGMPVKLEKTFRGGNTPWKFWDIYTKFLKTGLGAIRSYVTSSGTPSMDLGIPPSAIYLVLMLRECRKELPEATIDQRVIAKINRFIEYYQERTLQNKDYDGFYKARFGLLDFLGDEFIGKLGEQFTSSQEKEIYKIREKIADMLGILKVVAKSKNDLRAIKQIDLVARRLFGLTQPIATIDDFTLFITSSRERLTAAIYKKFPIVFVAGHKNPDTDTVISSIAEAY